MRVIHLEDVRAEMRGVMGEDRHRVDATADDGSLDYLFRRMRGDLMDVYTRYGHEIGDDEEVCTPCPDCGGDVCVCDEQYLENWNGD